MNNDNDLNLHSMTKLSGWLRYCGVGGKATDEVKDLYEKAKSRMAKGGFTLRKWLTNDTTLRKHINQA